MLTKLKTTANNCRRDFQSLGLTGPRLLLALIFLLLMGQFLGFAGQLAHFSTHRAVVEAMNNDAGAGLEVAERSRWYNDNRFRYYGPLYYRLAHTLSWTVAPASDLGEASLNQERALHFALLALSLFSLYGLSFLLSSLLTENLSFRLLGAAALVPAFLSHQLWSEYLLIVHPDLFLALLSGTAMFLTWRMAAKSLSEPSLLAAAGAWGLALSTKLSSLFFMPGMLIFLWRGWTRETWVLCRRFTLFALLVYLVVGFPQNFDFPGNLKTLFGFSRYSAEFSFNEMATWWFHLGDQIWRPALALLGFFVFISAFGQARGLPTATRQDLIRWTVASALGFLILSFKNFLLVHDYYVFPFVAAFLVVFSWFLGLASRRIGRLQRGPIQAGLAVVGAGLLLVSFQAGPQTLLSVKTRFQACQEPLEKLHAEVRKWGGPVLSTPYTSVPKGASIKVHWEMRESVVEEFQPTALVFRTSFYKRFTEGAEPKEYFKINNPHWPESRAFFQKFQNQEKVFFAGREWLRHSDPDFKRCQIELWTTSQPL